MSSDLVQKAIANLISESWDAEAEAVRHRIEALEAEVAEANRIVKTYYAENERLETALDAAEARAERLREALVQFNNHFGPLADNVMLHDEARKCFHLARKALGDDKQ